MKTYTPEELGSILHKHQLWLDDEDGGERADLKGANLSWAKLSKADLRYADLEDANLTGANLTGDDLSNANLERAKLTRANLSWAKLSGANLSNANLTGANLTGADLTGAILTGADLTWAILTGADLTWANLTGANLTGAKIDDAPEVPNLCQAILTSVEANPESFEMGHWHNACGTTHCLAGWAVHLAGEAGHELESKVGTANAGIAIFLRSHGSVPNFYSDNDEALAWLQKEVAK